METNQLPVEIVDVSKAFGANQAVQDLSFSVKHGEIFGLLGPNGAGKTTAIRIILGLLQADKGKVNILGGSMSEDKKDRIGYMPEERGLYQDINLENCLYYLASLKGLNKKDIQKRLDNLLEKFDLEEHRRKKVKELSKGMQQKAQIISTIIHKPELLIVDEPFTGLDPVNTSMVKELLSDLREEGVTILMSTHQMHLVEELCNRLLLINRGSRILYGDLDDVRKNYAGHAVMLKTNVEITQINGVESIEKHNRAYLLNLQPETTPQEVLMEIVSCGVQVEQFEIAVPSLDEVFIQAVREEE